MKIKTGLMTAIGLTTLACLGHAAATVLDDFESRNAGLLNGQGGWKVALHGGRTATVTAGGLNYDNGSWNIPGGGKRLVLNIPFFADPPGDFLGLDFPARGGSGQSLYYRYTIKFFGEPSVFTMGFSGSNTVSISGTAFQYNRFNYGWKTVISDNTGNEGSGAESGIYPIGDPAITYPATMLVVGRVTFYASGADMGYVAINPVSKREFEVFNETLVGVGKSDVRDMGVTAFDYLGLKLVQGAISPIEIDNIVIGDSWEDILPKEAQPDYGPFQPYLGTLDGGYVDTGDWLGWVFLGYYPWVWRVETSEYMYSAGGTWFSIP